MRTRVRAVLYLLLLVGVSCAKDGDNPMGPEASSVPASPPSRPELESAWLDESEEYREDLTEMVIDVEWEQEQGQMREKLVCAVCGDAWLTPTARGTARPHVRRDIDQPSWGRIRQLRDDIKTLEAELDRLLQALEPD